MPNRTIWRLFEKLRKSARESNVIEGMPQFAAFVGTARAIFEQVGDLLALYVWERLTFDPEFPWPGVHRRRRSIGERRLMFRMHQRHLRRESVTLEDVRLALEFARRQALVMFNEIHIGLLRGDVRIPTDLRRRSALTLLELTAGFRRRWRALRRDLASQIRRSHHEL